MSSPCVGVGKNLIRIQNGSPRNVSLRCLPNHAQLLVSRLQTVGDTNACFAIDLSNEFLRTHTCMHTHAHTRYMCLHIYGFTFLFRHPNPKRRPTFVNLMDITAKHRSEIISETSQTDFNGQLVSADWRDHIQVCTENFYTEIEGSVKSESYFET